MAVEWEDLVTPQGELDIALLFPSDSDDGEIRLTGYLADGVVKVGDALTGDDADAAVTLWAQYRAYLQKYQDSLSSATSGVLVDSGSFQKLWSQINAWKELADERLAAFNALLESALADTDDALGGWKVLRSLRHA